MHGLILGAIVGGASSVVIMPALDLAGLDERLSNLLKLESALTDVLCVVGAITLIELAGGGAFDKDAVLSTLGKSFGIGLLYGVLGGLLWIVLHRLGRLEARIRSRYRAFDALCGDLALAAARLAILAAAVVIGNARSVTQLLKMKTQSPSAGRRAFSCVVSFMIKSFFLLYRFDVVAALVADRCRRRAGPRPACGPLATARGAGGAGFSRVSEVAASASARYGGWRAGDPPGSGGYLRYAGLPVVVFSCVVVTILAFAVGMPVMTQRIEQEAATDGDDDRTAAWRRCR